MIINFDDKGTEDVYNGVNSRLARKTLPVELRRIALRKFYFLENAVNLEDLRMPPGNHLEILHGDRLGQHSIRINDRYRICFVWSEKGPKQVEIVDYH
ncbi:MAG: plasmid maintenance system killer protein [Desulfobacteraceae bacterium 4572_123]|nr:MAG: plasmid maintenance system killer protein [Desulfobacteraceae bacterium 4572_123]